MLCRSFMCFQLNLYTCVVYYFMNTMFVASCCFLFLRISSPNLVRPPSGAFGLFYLSFRLNIWKSLRRHILDTYWQNSKIETKKMRQLLKSIQSLWHMHTYIYVYTCTYSKHVKIYKHVLWHVTHSVKTINPVHNICKCENDLIVWSRTWNLMKQHINNGGNTTVRNSYKSYVGTLLNILCAKHTRKRLNRFDTLYKQAGGKNLCKTDENCHKAWNTSVAAIYLCFHMTYENTKNELVWSTQTPMQNLQHAVQSIKSYKRYMGHFAN